MWCLSTLRAGGGGSDSSGDDDTGDDTAADGTPTDDTTSTDGTATDDTPTDTGYDGSVNTTTSNDADSGMINQEGMLYGAVGLGGIAVLASLFYRSVSLPT